MVVDRNVACLLFSASFIAILLVFILVPMSFSYVDHHGHPSALDAGDMVMQEGNHSEEDAIRCQGVQSMKSEWE